MNATRMFRSRRGSFIQIWNVKCWYVDEDLWYQNLYFRGERLRHQLNHSLCEKGWKCDPVKWDCETEKGTVRPRNLVIICMWKWIDACVSEWKWIIQKRIFQWQHMRVNDKAWLSKQVRDTKYESQWTNDSMDLSPDGWKWLVWWVGVSEYLGWCVKSGEFPMVKTKRSYCMLPNAHSRKCYTHTSNYKVLVVLPLVIDIMYEYSTVDFMTFYIT